MTTKSNFSAPLSLLPLLVFVALFLGAGIYHQLQGTAYAFYQLPAPIAALPAIILAILLAKEPINQAMETFVKGAGNSNIITMCMIFLLAGAFSTVAKATGGVDAAVNATLSILPPSLLLPGLFVVSALIATAMGTSMGTIGAIAPIALGFSEQTSIEPALLAGAVLSGAMFGDNLSIISDTTIAATRSQGCEMKDKFRENFFIALPAAIGAILLFFFMTPSVEQVTVADANLWLALPYVAILLLALLGINVFVVLSCGILFAGLIGLTNGYSAASFFSDIYAGFGSMQEVFLLSMFIGGLSAFIAKQGGLQWLADSIQRFITRVKGIKPAVADQLGIAAVIVSANLCIANNTVSIVATGSVAKRLAADGNISARRAASLLDIFSCVVQGLIPYGAQLLLLAATFEITPWSIAGYAWYIHLLALCAIIAILRYRPTPADNA